MDWIIAGNFDAFIFSLLFVDVCCVFEGVEEVEVVLSNDPAILKFILLCIIVQGIPTFDLFGRYCTGELASRDEVALVFRAADLHVSASRMETVGFTVP